MGTVGRQTAGESAGDPDDWAKTQVKRLGQMLVELRGRRTGQWLCDETERLGYRVSRSTLHELETGKRRFISTAELAVLAWALKVPPLRLLYPDLPDGPVEMVPGRPVPSVEAVMWWSGEVSYAPPFGDAEAPLSEQQRQDTVEFHEGSELLRLSRERAQLRERLSALTGLVSRLPRGSAETAISEIVSTQDRITRLSVTIGQLGGVVSDA